MDAPHRRGPAGELRPRYDDYPDTPLRAASQGYAGQPFDFLHDASAPPPGGGGGFGGHRFAFPYGFDSSVPPPPLGGPPAARFPDMMPPPPLHAYSGAGTFPPGFGSQFRTRDDRDSGQRLLQRGREGGSPVGRPEDDGALQRKLDRQWLRRFLQSREEPPGTSRRRQQGGCVPELRAALDGAAQLVSRLRVSCAALSSEAGWGDAYLKALELRSELEDKLAVLHSVRLDVWKDKLSRIKKRRDRLRRAGRRRQEEDAQRRERAAEKEAAIDKWRTEQIRRVQEKKTEQELKLAADAVLCEVRRKQADVKRMQDVLRSLEKLRRLRKDAASRKGIATEPEHDEAFAGGLGRLGDVLKTRTAVYAAEENALMVMLEGEQEEERKRERDKREKRERERLLQKERQAEAMLFGGMSSRRSPSVLRRAAGLTVLSASQRSFLLLRGCCPTESITPRPSAPCWLCSTSGASGTGLWLQRTVLKVLLFLQAGSSQTSRQIRPGPLPYRAVSDTMLSPAGRDSSTPPERLLLLCFLFFVLQS
ncbi:programmed cell death protein 7 isoform X1 [Brachionichthys hirsutus]|uniref:programmed cell death protein 7 isoform X1 n=1 Tax=Brachionichthys hirsutus TaxID=412623 RepID=UPI0036053A19